MKTYFNRHYYALIVFAFCIIYSCTILGDFATYGVDKAVSAIHAVDFGMGFCSKLLPGAIYNIFFDDVSKIKTSVYLIILLTGFFLVLSFMIEKFLLNIKSDNRKTAFILLAFFLTGPASFAIHVYYPGMLDMYWVFCALLFFVLLSTKHLKPLIVLSFALCVMIYFSSLICFIPFFAIILLYEITYAQSKNQKAALWSLLIVSVIVSVGLGIYFAVFESGNLVYSIEEFHEIYSKKGVDDFFYFDQSLYKDVSTLSYSYYPTDEIVANSKINNIFLEIIFRIKLNLENITFKDKIIIVALISPIVAFIFHFMLHQFKTNLKENNKLRCFLNICTVVLPFFTILVSIPFSIDPVRWISHAFITLFSTFLFLLFKEGEYAWDWVKEKLSKIPFIVIMFYFTFYAATIYHPYYAG